MDEPLMDRFIDNMDALNLVSLLFYDLATFVRGTQLLGCGIPNDIPS